MRIFDSDLTDQHGLVRSVAYLIRSAIFRPRHSTGGVGRFSLNIRPLGQLIDMYHSRRATERRDKVYALLGMCSDDPAVAGLAANYETPWGEVFRKLIHFSLSPSVSVDTWDDKEVAVIRAKGCVLGRIMSVRPDYARSDRQLVGVFWTNETDDDDDDDEPEQEIRTLQVTAKPIRKGDLVALVSAAKDLTILRPQGDHFAVVQLSSPLTELVRERFASIVSFPNNFLLTWDWDTSQEWQTIDDYEQYMACQGVFDAPETEVEGYAARATRLLDVAWVLRRAGAFNEADSAAAKAIDVCETACEKLGGAVLAGRIADLLVRDEGGWKPLYAAAERGCTFVVRCFLDAGKIDQDRHGQGMLERAAAKGHKVIVQLLLGAGAADGMRALRRVAENRDMAATWLLLDMGVADALCRAAEEQTQESLRPKLPQSLLDINRTGRQPILWWTVENFHEVIFKLFFGAEVISPVEMLREAAKQGHEEASQLLRCRCSSPPEMMSSRFGGWNLNSRTQMNWLLWSEAIVHQSTAIATLFILARKSDPSLKRDPPIPGLVLYAVEHRSEEILKLLLDAAKDELDAGAWTSWYFEDALHYAARHGYEEIVRLLLVTGKVDPNARAFCYDGESSTWTTPLYQAVRIKSEAIVEMLLDTGKVDVNAGGLNDGPRKTVLHQAAGTGSETIVKMLLDTDEVDLNAQDDFGHTALHWAAAEGHIGVAKLLLGTGKVDLSVQNQPGTDTALHCAAYNGHKAVVGLLLDAGQFDVNAQNQSGETALHRAAYGGSTAVVGLLLDTSRVDPNARNKSGNTALHMAIAQGHDEVVKLLLANSRVDLYSRDKQG